MDRGLQTLSVQNFQILGNVTVHLGRLNVLVGPNGSGKSTLLQLVQFLGDAARSGLSSAVARRGGIQSVWTRRKKLGDIQINVTALLTTHAKIAGIAKTEARTRKVVAVLAHEDCDALEPEHVRVAEKLERELSDAGCPNPTAVAPAWETETWWLIFPEAVGKVVQGWRDPDDWLGKDVGRVEHAKERLAKAVQPRLARKSPPRPYHERDSIAIAQNIVADGLLQSFDSGRRRTPHPSGSMRHTRSASFEQFRRKVLAISSVEAPDA